MSNHPADRPSHVLLFADRLPPRIGGMERHAGAFIDHFRTSQRFPLAGIVTRDPDGQDVLIDGETAKRMHLTELPMALRHKPAIVFFNSGRWIEDLDMLRARVPDAFFSYRTGGNEIIKAPLGDGAPTSHAARQQVWVSSLNRSLDQLITNSAYTERRLQSIGVRGDLFLRCVGGVDPIGEHVARPAQTGRRVLLCAARFVPYKRHEQLIRVVEHLVRRGLDVGLRLAGDGPLLERTRSLAAPLAATGRVVFLGAIAPAEVRHQMIAADYYVQLSGDQVTEVEGGSYVHAEGMGRSILEAIATGTFVVAGHSGALDEIVTDGRGFLVDPDDLGSVVTAMERLLASPTPRPPATDRFAWSALFSRYESSWADR